MLPNKQLMNNPTNNKIVQTNKSLIQKSNLTIYIPIVYKKFKKLF
jgi:hypothetical protein